MTEPASQRPPRTSNPKSVTPCEKPSLNWRSVTQGVCDGCNDSFELLYNEFFDYIFFHVRQATGRDEPTCLDITQESWLKIIHSMKPIDHRFQLAAWIRAVARSVSYDWLRKESRLADRQRRYHSSLADSQSGKDSLEIGPSLQDADDSFAVDDAARLQWLQHELNELPAETRSMIAFRYRFGWTLQKIAEQFGLKAGAVDGRIRRTVSRLRQKAQLAEQEFDSDMPYSGHSNSD